MEEESYLTVLFCFPVGTRNAKNKVHIHSCPYLVSQYKLMEEIACGHKKSQVRSGESLQQDQVKVEI